MTTPDARPERRMTKEDWLMLYHLRQLGDQVILHGADYVRRQLRAARKELTHE